MYLGVSVQFFGTHTLLYIYVQSLELNLFMASHHYGTPFYGHQPSDVADFPTFLWSMTFGCSWSPHLLKGPQPSNVADIPTSLRTTTFRGSWPLYLFMGPQPSDVAGLQNLDVADLPRSSRPSLFLPSHPNWALIRGMFWILCHPNSLSSLLCPTFHIFLFLDNP